ncbi:MAG: hypothetical protein QXS32_07815 [Candidatus Nezhaarchaeales archaeon]
MERSYHDKNFLKLLDEYRGEVMPVRLDAARSLKEAFEEMVAVKRSLISKRKGSKLMKVGLACIAFPEPILSNIVGGLLVALGCWMRGREGGNLKDMLEAVRELRSFLTSHTL